MSFAWQKTSNSPAPAREAGIAHASAAVPVAIVRGMLSGLAVPVPPPWLGELLRQCGIAPEWLRLEGACITGVQYAGLYRRLIDRLDDECVGLLSRPLRRGSFALIARSALGARTVRGAFHRIIRALGILIDDVSIEHVTGNGLAGMMVTPRGTAAPPDFFFELLLRVGWGLTAWLGGGRLPLPRVEFCFPRPAYAALYENAFPAALAFDRPAATIWFTAAELETPIRRDARELEEFLTGTPANVLLAWPVNRGLGTRIYNRLLDERPLWPGLKPLAQELNMSVSTLQRRLAAEGASYRSIKDGLRRDLAAMRLVTGEATLSTLAAELGYSDAAAFQRAFKGWTGLAPGAYRQRRRQAGFAP